jgi:hypothetical protein
MFGFRARVISLPANWLLASEGVIGFDFLK